LVHATRKGAVRRRPPPRVPRDHHLPARAGRRQAVNSVTECSVGRPSVRYFPQSASKDASWLSAFGYCLSINVRASVPFRISSCAFAQPGRDSKISFLQISKIAQRDLENPGSGDSIVMFCRIQRSPERSKLTWMRSILCH
jgi:hypothetical protein